MEGYKDINIGDKVVHIKVSVWGEDLNVSVQEYTYTKQTPKNHVLMQDGYVNGRKLVPFIPTVDRNLYLSSMRAESWVHVDDKEQATAELVLIIWNRAKHQLEEAQKVYDNIDAKAKQYLRK